MTRNVSKFQRSVHTDPTYVCGACGKRTRETGEGESSVELCRVCYVYYGVSNTHNDAGHEGKVHECLECKGELQGIPTNVTP